MSETSFIAPFLSGTTKLGIVGQGYVGLPLADTFAESGVHILGFDVDREKVDLINKGESYIQDVKTDRLKRWVDAGLVEATTDFSRLAECDAISICVPTPLSKSKSPDMSFIEAVLLEVVSNLRPGQLIVLESTTYPGTTDELVLPQLQATGLTVGKDFFLAFSPERVDPGNPKYGVKNTPKIIGGITEECTKLAVELYSHALDHVHPVRGTREAEMVKLLENTYRAVNIGFVNEFAKMCDTLDVDVWQVIDAAATKPFGFTAFYPGPGLGGHCIPIDPLYLSWKLSHLDYKAQFIDLADSINGSMPQYVVRKVMEQLNEDSLALKGSRILIMGMAYKENIDDVRESPALDVASLLFKSGADVVYHDPFVKECRIDGKTLTSQELTEDEIKKATLVLIVTGHDCIDYGWVVSKAARVFDAKNSTGKLNTNGKVWRL